MRDRLEDEEETIEKARGWTFDLLFTGFIFILVDVMVIGSAIASGKSITSSWPYWILLILIMLLGIGFLYFGMLKLNRVRELAEERD